MNSLYDLKDVMKHKIDYLSFNKAGFSNEIYKNIYKPNDDSYCLLYTILHDLNLKGYTGKNNNIMIELG